MKYTVRVTSTSILCTPEPSLEKYVGIYFMIRFDVSFKEAESLVRHFLRQIALEDEKTWNIETSALSRQTLLKLFLWDAKKNYGLSSNADLFFNQSI